MLLPSKDQGKYDDWRGLTGGRLLPMHMGRSHVTGTGTGMGTKSESESLGPGDRLVAVGSDEAHPPVAGPSPLSLPTGCRPMVMRARLTTTQEDTRRHRNAMHIMHARGSVKRAAARPRLTVDSEDEDDSSQGTTGAPHTGITLDPHPEAD